MARTIRALTCTVLASTKIRARCQGWLIPEIATAGNTTNFINLIRRKLKLKNSCELLPWYLYIGKRLLLWIFPRLSNFLACIAHVSLAWFILPSLPQTLTISNFVCDLHFTVFVNLIGISSITQSFEFNHEIVCRTFFKARFGLLWDF